jgi:prolyl 4-hydroxylase
MSLQPYDIEVGRLVDAGTANVPKKFGLPDTHPACDVALRIAAQHARGCCPAQIFNELTESGLTPDEAVNAIGQALPDEDAEVLGTLLRPCPDRWYATSSLSMGDAEVRLLLQRRDPHLALFEGFASPDECNAIIEATRERLAPIAVGGPAGDLQIVSRLRSSRGARLWVHESELARRIIGRAAELLDWPATHFENVAVQQYRSGEEFRPHVDYFAPGSEGLRWGGQRVATMLVYLNTPLGGGCTDFPNAGLRVHPVQGGAVSFTYPDRSFPKATLHAGRPVTAGEKWIATLWMRQGPHRLPLTPA